MQEKHDFERAPDFEKMTSEEIVEEFVQTIRAILERAIADLPGCFSDYVSEIDSEISSEIKMEDFQ